MQILYNAKIYTLDTTAPVASALAVEGGRVIAVGDQDELLNGFSGRIERQNLGGSVVIPGLTDAHIHLEHYALGLQKVDCETPTLSECLRRIADRARVTPPGEWILGHGWNQNLWVEENPNTSGYGTADELEEAAIGRPAYLTAKSLHAAWANSSALRLAEVNKNTPDPEGGYIQRDEEGNPTGILFESAMKLVGDIVPEQTAEQVGQAMASAFPVLWQMGVTGVHDFDRRRCFIALQILRQRGELSLRVVKGIHLEDLTHAATLGLRSGFGDEFLRIGSVKAFADGALGPRTAAMLQPYQGEPDNRGMLLLDAEELFEHGKLAVDNGFSLAVHAIGDLANHEVLNAYAQIRDYERSKLTPGRELMRHRIEHVQLIHAQDAPRLAELGIVASMQPLHATSDMLMADRYWEERAALSYAWRAQLDQGAVLAFGSDAPVESPNPFWGLYTAVTRRRLDGAPGIEGWYPSQRISFAEAVKAYTSGPAYAAGLDDRLGKLAPGYLADLLVLERDPFQCDPEELKDFLPLRTMIDGEWVYTR